ncbi:retrovirus-related pol polyprotein from transposon TNT 1-94 [Tanacetum coccineum]
MVNHLNRITYGFYIDDDACRNQCNVTNHQSDVQSSSSTTRMAKIRTKDEHVLLIQCTVAQQQPVYHPPNHPTQNTQYSSTRSQQSTRNRGKAIVTSSAPTYDPEPAMVTEDEEMFKEKEIDKPIGFNFSLAQLQEVTPDPVDNSGPIFDDEPTHQVQNNNDNYNVFAMENEHPEQPESSNDIYLTEQGNSNITIDSLDICYDRAQDDQDETNDLDQERDLLASLIKKLKCEIDDSKNRNKFLESSNKELVNKLKEDSSELDKYKDVNYASKVEIDCAKAKGDLMSYKIDFEKSSNAYTQQINDLNQTISDMKKELYNELDKVIALENKVKSSSESLRANPRLYDIGCYNDNLALMLAPDSDETIRLEKERRSKLSDLIRPFDYDQLNNLYDLFVPQREKSAEQHYFPKTSKMSHTSSNKEFSKESFRKQTTLLEKRMDESIPWDQKCKSSKELFKIKKSVDTIFDGVERCKQTIAKRTYFGNIDPFIQNTIEGNFGPQISRLNADLENFHLCLNEEMVADLRYFNSLEHEVDTLKSQLETQKTQFLNEIDRLSREYYYADHMNAILGVYTDLDEFTNLQCDYVETWEKCEHLEKELSKSRTMSKSFEALQKHAINLELDLQQCKEKIKNDKSFKENQSNVFLKEREQYFEIQDLKAQLQDKGIAISELKKLIEKMKGKSVETKFEKSSVIRQPNAFKSQRQSILGKPAIFSDSLAKKDFSKSKSVTTQNVSHDFSKPVTAQILPQNVLPIFKNINVIAPGMYKVHTKPNQTRTPRLPQDIRKTNKRVSFSTGVIPNTSVSRPQLKSNHLEDRVMSNNSQGKKQEVEDHRRKFKFSNNKTSVTACNDSLNAKTSNVNFVCVTYGKCVLNNNHDLCVLHYLNGVNSRTRQPMAVLISTREPKHNVNQSVATSSKQTIVTDSTIKKSRNITRKFYEQVSKACSWWYPKYTPLGYNWKPKSQIGNVNPNLVEIIIFIVDSGCSKHMTGNLKLLTNFVEKFLGTVKSGNDQITPILGYRDLGQGTITIKRVYYVKGLNHNLFSVGQFYDVDLEVAFWKSTCYIRDLKGNDLLTGSRGTDLYSITLQDSTTPNPICLMAKATSSQAWLWHRRLSHLNFDTINLLLKNNIVNRLLKLKFVKDHLCSCELGKAKRKSSHTKTTPSSKRRLQLLHMDLCGPMWVESINGKKYVLVIVDDYSRYTWTHFLRSKDETPRVLIDFLTLVQRGLHAQVTTVRTDKGTKFLNKTLHAYFAKEGIRHETSTARTPEQNGVVERRNHTLVEATRTMLSVAKVSLFFCAEANATASFTQNRSLVIPQHEKIPYHIINARKSSVKFFHIFSSLCYIVRDGENLDKMKEKGDACIFVRYSTQSKAYRVFNKRTRIIVETIHVNFDEMPQMALDRVSSDPGPQCSTTVLEQESLSPDPQSQENVSQTAETETTSNELELLYSPMYSELLNGTSPVMSNSFVVHAADNPDKRQQHNITHTSITTDVADPPPLNIQSTHQTPTQVPTVTAPENIIQAETNTKNAQFDEDEFINIFSTPVQEQGETCILYINIVPLHNVGQKIIH